MASGQVSRHQPWDALHREICTLATILCLLQPVASGTDGQYRMVVEDSEFVTHSGSFPL